MSPRDIVLFVHLVCMAGYFMTYGVELPGLAQRGRDESAEDGLSPARVALQFQQYAMLALFLTGGYLISFVKKDQGPSFLVTIVAFLAIGGLSGMASAKLEKGALSAKSWSSSLRLRLALSGAIVWLVSLKPDMAMSGVVVVAFLVLGLLAARI